MALKNKLCIFFPLVADWQDFLSTCPTARKTPCLSSFAVDNQQEIFPQFYWSLTIVGHLVLTEAANHMQYLTIAWQQGTYIRLLVTLSCKYNTVYAYAVLAHTHTCVVSKIDTCSAPVSCQFPHHAVWPQTLPSLELSWLEKAEVSLLPGVCDVVKVMAEDSLVNNNKVWDELGSAVGMCMNGIRQCFK